MGNHTSKTPAPRVSIVVVEYSKRRRTASALTCCNLAILAKLQMILQSGHMPSVLQQLCRLPFNYFSDKALRAILLPTLLACCHGNPANRDVLQKEMSYQVYIVNIRCQYRREYLKSFRLICNSDRGENRPKWDALSYLSHADGGGLRQQRRRPGRSSCSVGASRSQTLKINETSAVKARSVAFITGGFCCCCFP